MTSGPRTRADLERHYGAGLSVESVVRLEPGATLHLDERAVTRDFGWLIGHEGGRGSQSDRCRAFLARIGSVLGAPNLDAPEVNSRPRSLDQTVSCLRPPRYGRAGVLDLCEFFPEARPNAGDVALVDVKGIGVAEGRTPHPGNRETGLLTIVDALQELINKAILDCVFATEGVDLRCNEIYGIVDIGVWGYSQYFDVPLPCVVLLRRAHLRDPDNDELPAYGSPEDHAKSAIEWMLRRYGVTSAPAQCALRVSEDEAGRLVATLDGQDLLGRVPPEILRHHLDLCGLELPQTIRFINIQTASDLSVDPLAGTVIDLGHYTVLHAFDDHHLVAPVKDRPLNWGRLFRRGDTEWVEPDPAVCADPMRLGKASFASEVVRTMPLSEQMARSHEAGMIPGSMREAARLAALLLAGAIAPDRLGEAAERFVAETMVGACRSTSR